MLSAAPKSIDNLPVEILQYIFSFLLPQDLTKIASMKKSWLQASNKASLWQEFIRQHFSFLPEPRTSEFATNPKALFITEYKKIIRYYERYANTVKPYILAALRFDVDKFAGVTKDEKEELNTLAVSNNHTDAISLLDNSGLPYAFFLASMRGSLKPVQIIINKLHEIMQRRPLGKEQIELGKKRYLIYGHALNIAASKGHGLVVKEIYAQVGRQISTEDKGKAIYAASQNRHRPVVEEIITQATQSGEFAAVKAAYINYSDALKQMNLLAQNLPRATFINSNVQSSKKRIRGSEVKELLTEANAFLKRRKK